MPICTWPAETDAETTDCVAHLMCEKGRSRLDGVYRCSYDCRKPACGGREQVPMGNPAEAELVHSEITVVMQRSLSGEAHDQV